MEQPRVSAPGPVAGTFLVLLLTLAASVALRAYGGILWGLPDRFHPDEPFILDRAAAMVSTGDPNPRWFRYPSLYIYVQAAVEPLGAPSQGLFDSKYRGEASPSALVQARQLAVGRLVTVIVGALSVGGVFLLGLRGYSRVAGLIGAAFLAVHVPHLANSQWVTTDVPSAAAVLGTAICSLTALKRRSLTWILAGAVGAGLAASLKYNAGISLIMPLVAAAMLWRGTTLVRNAAAIAVLSGAAFLATTPYALVEFARFSSDLKFEIDHYSTGHAGAEGGDTWRWYIDRFLLSAPYTGIVMGIGVAYAIARRKTQDLVLLSFVLAYYLVIGSQVVRFERNLMPLVPIASVLGGRVAAETLAAAGHFKLRPLAIALVSAGLVLVFTSATVDSVRYDRRLLIQDTRHVARDWINDNISPGSRMVKEFYTPTLGPEFALQESFGLYERDFREVVCQFQYVVASGGIYDRYFVASNPYPDRREFYERLFKLPVVEKVSPTKAAGGPTVVIFRVPGDACLDQIPNLSKPSDTDPYAVSWGAETTPATMAANSLTSVTISFGNGGSLSWSASAPNPINLSYHWRSGACPGTGTLVWDGLRTALPWQVKPGEAIHFLTARVRAPATAGQYCLQYDLVREGITWFSTRSEPVLSVSVTVP